MVDVRCKDRADTFQRLGTLQDDDPELQVVLHGPESAVEPTSMLRRQNETESWGSYSGDLGCRTAWPYTAEQLLTPLGGDSKSFRMWSPIPPGELASNCCPSDIDYEPIRLIR